VPESSKPQNDDPLEASVPEGTVPLESTLALVYLTEARHVNGEVLHADAGAHNGKW
jgi:hypothetical protein